MAEYRSFTGIKLRIFSKDKRKTHLSSGDIHHTWKIYYGDTPIFVKSNLREFLPNFKNEAEQLDMLAKSQTIRTPRVLGIGNSKDASFLLLEFLPVQSLRLIALIVLVNN